MEKTNQTLKIGYLICLFLALTIWSMATTSGSGPDEAMKYDICNYIASHGKLPDGTDPALRNPIWGISYGFTPILSYMISGVFLKIAFLFTTNVYWLYVAVRFTSVLSITGMAYLMFQIGEYLFQTNRSRFLFVMSGTLLPQVMYLGSYLNNDSFALFTIAWIIYAWLRGRDRHWDWKSCILLGTGIGLCALSYYNAYGYLLMSIPFFFISYWKERQIEGEGKRTDMHRMFRMAAVIAIVAILLAGWWFIRSAILYDGDFLGLRTTDKYGEMYAQPGFRPSERPTPYHQGWSWHQMLFTSGWLRTSLISFIGILRTCDWNLMGRGYLGIGILFLAGIIGYLAGGWKRKIFSSDRLLHITFLICMVIPCGLSIYYSFYSDYQPQGRYLMPMLIPLLYFVTTGLTLVLEKIPQKVNRMLYGGIYMFFILISAASFYYVHALI